MRRRRRRRRNQKKKKKKKLTSLLSTLSPSPLPNPPPPPPPQPNPNPLSPQANFDAGKLPHFLPSTAHVRAGDWKVAPLPADILDRRVEITGPVDRKMVINALNSGAQVFMADFEDSNAPSWRNQVEGQANLADAVRRSISFEDPRSGKRYALGPSPAVLFVRPRGWHLPESHFVVDGRAVPGALFDFGMYFFHNARELVARGTGPYFYLPKMQSHLEARLWNEVFLDAQHSLGLPSGTIKATCLIETLPGAWERKEERFFEQERGVSREPGKKSGKRRKKKKTHFFSFCLSSFSHQKTPQKKKKKTSTAAFEMDEFLYELREHSAGLNCGRWDYIFSLIKTLRELPGAVVPDRGAVGMTQHCMRSYSLLLIKTCHRRGVHAMGGMAAQIPIKGDDAANAAALAKVKADKLRVSWKFFFFFFPSFFRVFFRGRGKIEKEKLTLS